MRTRASAIKRRLLRRRVKGDVRDRGPGFVVVLIGLGTLFLVALFLFSVSLG